MTITEQIKPGLRYKMISTADKKESNAFLSRLPDALLLTCEFSGIECAPSYQHPMGSYNIEFVFLPDYLKSFTSAGNIDLDQFPEHRQHDLCCNTQMILHEIINCKLAGIYRNMFLESRALSLLLCFQKYSVAESECGSCKFLTKPVEKEKIVKARKILLDGIHNPPTIAELSLQVGINQCYLKKGFKEMFGTTVYDYVQEQRMQKARLLLTTSQYSVTEVANQIGFSSTSNFSAAFKKFAGVFPSELQKN